MNFLNKDFLENKDNLLDLKNNLLHLIKLNQEVLDNHKQILIEYLIKISDYNTCNTEADIADVMVKFLADIKENFSILDVSYSLLKDYRSMLNKELLKSDHEIINNIIINYYEISKQLTQNIIKIDKFLYDANKYLNLSFNIEQNSKAVNECEADKKNSSFDNTIELERNINIINVENNEERK